MQKKMELVPELLTYASEVLKNNYTCGSVRIWLEEHHYKIEEFFSALTCIKKGNLENESYLEVAQEFLDKFRGEIMTNWSPKFYQSEQSPLLQEILASLKDETYSAISSSI